MADHAETSAGTHSAGTHAAPLDPHAESHGHSTAAWTGVGIMLLGTALICLGMVTPWNILWIVGIPVFVAGIIAWIAMNKAGYGDGGPKNTMGH